jgi:hypothetical protein
MEQPIAKRVKHARKGNIDLAPLSNRIKELLAQRNESLRSAHGVVVQFKPPQIHPSLSILFTPWITFWRTRHYDPSHWETDPLLAQLITKARCGNPASRNAIAINNHPLIYRFSAKECSKSIDNHWVAARYPRSKPAAPRIKVPVPTAVR